MVVVLAPTSGVQSGLVLRVADVLVGVGLPRQLVTYDRVELLANVAMVVPAGAFAALSFPRPGRRGWTAYAFLASLAVELVQGVVLPAREASASDVVANTLGALLGSLLGGWLARRWPTDSSRRPRRGAQ